MVKKNICATADDSDADTVEAWMEEAPKRVSHTRGNYKTYGGVPCKTKQEKKESKAIRQKKWKTNQKTEAARKFTADKKRALNKAHAIQKTKGFKKESADLANLREEIVQLRSQLAKCKTAQGASKPLDLYRQKMYNEMVDVLVTLKQKNHSEIYKRDIACPNLDSWCKSSRIPLRVFVRSFMSKSDNLVKSKYPEE